MATLQRDITGGATARPSRRPVAVLVPLCCGGLAAVGALVAPTLILGALVVPVVMVPVALLVLVGIGWAHTAILRAVTGRRWTGLAVVLALLVPVGVVAVISVQGELPLDPVHGIPVPVGIGAVAAGISTFALPRWTKAVGVLTILAVAVLVTSNTVQEDAAAREEHDAELAARYDQLLHGATTTLPGADTRLVRFTASDVEVAVDREGRELLIRNSMLDTRPGDDPDDVVACRLLTGEGSEVAGRTMDDFAGRCHALEPHGWVTADGLAYGTFLHGDWVTVVAGHGATAEDVAAVSETLTDLPESVRRPYWDELMDAPFETSGA
jgi:hypothetical protein